MEQEREVEEERTLYGFLDFEDEEEEEVEQRIGGGEEHAWVRRGGEAGGAIVDGVERIKEPLRVASAKQSFFSFSVSLMASEGWKRMRIERWIDFYLIFFSLLIIIFVRVITMYVIFIYFLRFFYIYILTKLYELNKLVKISC